jgi:hypothetical protein
MFEVFDCYSIHMRCEPGHAANGISNSSVSGMTLLKTFSICGIILACVVVILMNPFVWIPDLFSDRVITLGQMQTAEGDSLGVTQQFVGDGYLTRFYHTNKTGQSWETVFDGDAYRAWRVTFERSNNVVTIHAIRRSFFYNLETHAMTDIEGASRSVVEKPAL